MAAWVGASACGGDDVPADAGGDSTAPDGGTTDSGTGGDGGEPTFEVVVAPPEIPWLADGSPVTMTPCPDGWRETSANGVTGCEPYPVSGPSECAFGQAHFPGEAGCAPIGSTCPAGQYAEGLPSDGSVRYVDDDAPAGGDGSAGAPYADLAAVPWDRLPAGTTVALAKGRYAGSFTMSASTRVVGACAAETVLTGNTSSTVPVVRVMGTGDAGFLSDVSFMDTPQFAASVTDGEVLELEGVLIERAEGGLLAQDAGSVIRADTVVIREGVPEADGRFGRGMSVQSSARIEATRVIVADNRDIGVFVNSGAEAVLTDFAVIGTRGRVSDATIGSGIWLQNGARLTAMRGFVFDNRRQGIRMSRGEATLRYVVVRGTREQASDDEDGTGIEVRPESRLEARRVLVDDNRTNAIYVLGSSEAVLEDVVLRGTRERRSDGEYGLGLAAEMGARLTASRLVIDDNRTGAFVSASEVTLTDTLMRGQRERESGTGGRGVRLQGEGSLTASRLVVDDNRTAGIEAVEGSHVSVTDALVRGTRPRALDDDAGWAVRVDASRLDATRMEVVDNAYAGLLVFNGGVAELTDARIAETTPRQTDDSIGRGIDVEAAATLRATRLLVEKSRDVGIFASSDSAVRLTGAIVRGTREAADDGAGGRGINLQLGVRIEASQVLVEDNRGIGLYASEAQGTLNEVIVRGTREQMRDGTGGTGIVLESSTVDATAVRVEDNREYGVVLLESDMVAENLGVRETRAQAGDGRFGHGLVIAVDSSLMGRGIVVDGADRFGLVVQSRSTVTLSDVEVANVARPSGAEETRSTGHGIACIDSTTELTGFRVSDAAVCGIFVSERTGTPPTVMTLSDGVVERSTFGACVQVDGYDLAQLTDGVVYRDNQSNLETTSLPVPDVPEPAEDL